MPLVCLVSLQRLSQPLKKLAVSHTLQSPSNSVVYVADWSPEERCEQVEVWCSQSGGKVQLLDATRPKTATGARARNLTRVSRSRVQLTSLPLDHE